MSLVDKVYSTGHGHCSITRVFHAWKSAMGHIQKYQNTLCLSSIIYYKHCLQSLLGLTMVSREIENNAYVKFWRDNKKYYGFFFFFSILHTNSTRKTRVKHSCKKYTRKYTQIRKTCV